MNSASAASWAGGPGSGGTHTFIVPDQPRAEALADALAEFGFPLVTAQQYREAVRWSSDADDVAGGGGADWEQQVALNGAEQR